MKIQIDPAVALTEARAEIAWLRERNLILAQAIHQLKQQAAEAAQEEDDGQ